MKPLERRFTELLEDNMGRLQELFDKVAEKNPQKALELMLKLILSQNNHFILEYFYNTPQLYQMFLLLEQYGQLFDLFQD